jgi:hypothetical protein
MELRQQAGGDVKVTRLYQSGENTKRQYRGPDDGAFFGGSFGAEGAIALDLGSYQPGRVSSGFRRCLIWSV